VALIKFLFTLDFELFFVTPIEIKITKTRAAMSKTEQQEVSESYLVYNSEQTSSRTMEFRGYQAFLVTLFIF